MESSSSTSSKNCALYSIKNVAEFLNLKFTVIFFFNYGIIYCKLPFAMLFGIDDGDVGGVLAF